MGLDCGLRRNDGAGARMTGGWARFIAPLQKNLPLSAGPLSIAKR